MARETGELSPWQKLVAQHYGGGDYAHLQNIEECQDVGDTLFTFLMIELDPGEGCDDMHEARRRLVSARDDVEAVLDKVVEADEARN